MLKFIKNNKFAISGFVLPYFTLWIGGNDNIFSRSPEQSMCFLLGIVFSALASVMD